MSEDEAAAMVEHVNMLPIFERTPTAQQLGERLRVTNAERQLLRLWPFKPVDATEDDLAAQRRERRNAVRRAKRDRTHAQYLATCLTATKPWLSEGISRRTWERRRAKNVSQVAVPIIVTKAVPRVATSDKRRGRGGLQGGGWAKTELAIATERGRMDSHASGLARLRPRVATRKEQKGCTKNSPVATIISWTDDEVRDACHAGDLAYARALIMAGHGSIIPISLRQVA
jgi:hypothetical protein